MTIHFVYIAQSGGGEYSRAHNQMMIISSRFCSARRISEWLLRSTSLQFLPFSTRDQGSAEAGDGSVVKKVCLDDSIYATYF